ncbi:MAG: glycosyltransferase [Planctomycetes bacterium]|nr:glycosyltransferase [Planctomycetota bacterium]
MAMRDRGHNVAIICPRKKPEDDHSAMSESHGMRIVRYNHPRLPNWHPRRGERAIQAAADATRKWLGDQKWDVVHIHMPLTGAGVMSALGHGPRYIYTMHSPVVLEQKINWAHQGISGRLKLALGLGRIKRLESDLLNKCAGIQTLSEFTRREVGRFHGLADQVTVVPHWRRSDLKRTHTKEEARRLLGWPENQKILFTVRRHASRHGWTLEVIDAGEFADRRYLANPVNRCFFCKANLYRAIAGATDAQILSGANLDDLGDYRPGLAAAADYRVRHPLIEAGIDKAMVRRLAAAAGLSDLRQLPAAPCLSSRLVTGIPVTAERLRLVLEVERLLKARLGAARTVRCRVRENGVEVQLDDAALDRLDAGARRALERRIAGLCDRHGVPPAVNFAGYVRGSAFVGKPMDAD